MHLIPISPKIAVKEVATDLFKLSHHALNVVFKPGAFGGQLMSASLNSATQSTSPLYSPCSMRSSFLGPTLIGSDVYFKSELVRKSGKTFLTRRVTGRQLSEGETIDELPSKPVLFEQTVAFYRSPSVEYADISSSLISLMYSSFPMPSTKSDLEDAETLDELLGRIKAGEVKRGPLYLMSLKMTQKLAEADMLTTIKLPRTPSTSHNYGKSVFYVGVPVELAISTKTVLPYISDGMTQVLACHDVLDPFLKAWPSKLTVWDYAMTFECNGPKGGEDRARPFLDNIGKRWFAIEYTISGARDGLGTGTTRIMDIDGPLLSSATFSYLLLK